MEVIWSDMSLQHMKEIAEYVADHFGQKQLLILCCEFRRKPTL